METENTFKIPVSAWGDFTKKIATLNRKAVKLGVDPVSYDLIREHKTKASHTFKTEDGEYTKEYDVLVREIKLIGIAPKLEGYQFIAKVEYLSDGESTLFHTVPGSEFKIDERFRTLTPATCEHCHKIRRRNETFIVRKTDTGEQFQVGRQCLADFTGINSPEKIAARASWLSSFSDLREDFGRFWSSHFADRLDTLHVLRLTSAYIGRFGWTPKSSYNGTPTATQVLEHFGGFSRDEKDREFRATMNDESNLPRHIERAEKVVTWIKDELSLKAKSDYEMNLVTLVSKNLIERQHLGIVCSAVAAYQRAMNQQIEYAKRKKDLESSEYVGEVDKRLRTIPVKVHFVKALEPGKWGPRTLVKFLDEKGNLLVWFASGDREYNRGDSFVLTGTVKKHEEYQGIKQTLLTRVSI